MEHGVHHIPGRIRYKIPGLGPDAMQAVRRALERCDDVEHVEARPASASLIIHYDPAHTDARRLGRCIDSALKTIPTSRPPGPLPKDTRRERFSDETVIRSVRHVGMVFGQTAFKVALEQAVRGGLNSLHRTVLAKS